MTRPRLLLIDDEPQLAAFVASAARMCGFDRRVLESAFRLGEALDLKMVGPLEKPARLDALETILKQNLPSEAR